MRRAKQEVTSKHKIAAQLLKFSVALESLSEDPQNANQHSAKSIKAIASSLDQFGQQTPIVVRGTTIYKGNGTWRAAKSLGWTHIAAIPFDEAVAKRKGKDTVRAYAIVDNRSSQFAEFDPSVLSVQVEAWESNFDLQPFSFGEILPTTSRAGLDNEKDDTSPPLPAEARSKLGDIYQLGPHRILCGDATKRETIATLLRGLPEPVLFMSDPPYGVAHGKGVTKSASILGDQTQAAIPLSLAVVIPALHKDARIYLCGASENVTMMTGLFDHYLSRSPKIIVWAKENFVLRQNGYHSQYELIFFSWKGAGGAIWYGDRKQSDVWQIARGEKATNHPNEKPLEIPERAITNSSAQGEIVIDPFLGSGSTLIACEKLGRVCAGVELDPRYFDVVISRWEKFTGQTAKKIGDAASWVS
jgi:hypothetical protein